MLLALAFITTHALAGEAVPLFNGENLEGWDTWYRHDDKDQDLFAVKDGMIHVYPHQEQGSDQTFAGIVTQGEFSHYLLSLEYRWGEKKFQPRHDAVRDAGILFHVHGEAKIWPYSVECQVQEGDTGDIWAIGTAVTSTVNPVIRNYSPEGERVTRGGKPGKFSRFHRGYMWEVPGWNRVEVLVKGDYARFTVNGHIVNEAHDMKYHDTVTGKWKPLTSGKILLQAEGAELFYRNITIQALPQER
jgi:hypothetical protein